LVLLWFAMEKLMKILDFLECKNRFYMPKESSRMAT
jgi:hypothetical protein